MNGVAVITVEKARQIDRVRAEQARTLFRGCPVGVISAATGAVLLAVAFASSGRVPVAAAQLWIALMIGCVVLHLCLCVFYWRARPADRDWRPWLWSFTLIAGLEGITWLFGAIWMTSPTDLTQELIVLLVSSAIASGAVSVFGSYLPTYAVFFFPAISVHLGFALFYDYPLHGLLAALVLAYIVAMSLIARRNSEQLAEGLRLRFENMDLVEDLRLQKALADQANLAKSTFLASASHDLRQPIHALSLFIGALRGRKMDATARNLVDHIGESVAAMDDLFASLLDISRLDAGTVEARIEPIAVYPLLVRLCRDYEVEAQAKGIRLRLVQTRAIVASDAVLLERILRNLLSNAVRYTAKGGVLIGCRRRGADWSIDVCDTGCGIPAALHEKVFEEFYQVGNPERDRARGLGLGLAIVRRLSALISARLTFRSVPGRGSIFRLAVPRLPEATVLPLAQPHASGAIDQASVLVIDDETQIQHAMAALLSSWGCRVSVAGSLAEISATARPDLIICDYRLRDGVNGLDVIRTLQQRFGGGVPAMLITGDTAPARIAEAEASGFLILHKPLSNARLRAAVGNLLRRPAAD